ncbi:MAG: acetolactate synthase [Clostridiales bacterium]|nr:acetolactate synthase [Clostridiales bacterium]
MTVNQISVFIENKAGSLYGLTQVLAENHIDIRALYLAESSDFGIARLIVNDVYAASTLLKDSGYVHQVSPVLAVAVPDVPGGLNNLLHMFAEAEVNVEYMYAFLGDKKAGNAYMIFRVAEPVKAAASLRTKGVKILEQEDLSLL